MEKQVLIIGASGTVGSELVRILNADGVKTRSTTSKNVEGHSTYKVHVNLATGEGIREAFEGIEKAFLLSPPGYADHYAMLSPSIQEAKRRGLKKVVLMTAMGANADESSPFRRAEVELEKSGLNYNIVRPNWFLQNFNTFWIQGIRDQGKILLPAGKAKASFIDARDISAVIAKLLTTANFDNKAFDITGPEAVDHDQVASALSAATGKSISYQEIQPGDLLKGLRGAGLPKDYSEFLVMIMGFLREGYNAAVTANVKTILGRDPTGLQQYAQDHRKVWL